MQLPALDPNTVPSPPLVRHEWVMSPPKDLEEIFSKMLPSH